MSIVVVGAGPIGTTVTRTLVERGTPVRVLTRSGSGLDHPLVERRRVDVNDAAALAAATRDASVIHLCLHASAYHLATWEAELPRAEQAVLAAAEKVGAVVVFPESLYAFDRSGTITETTPHDATNGLPGVRARLLAARAASPARTVSVVASDYFGPGTGHNAHAGDRMLRPATTGGTARPIGSADQPHSWTYLPDLAAAMVRAAELPGRPDRLLLAPTSAPRTQREIATDYARAAGRPGARVRPLPTWTLRLAGLAGRAGRDARGIVSMVGLFERPLVMDSTASEAELGLSPTPWDDAVRTTVAAFTAVGRETPARA